MLIKSGIYLIYIALCRLANMMPIPQPAISYMMPFDLGLIVDLGSNTQLLYTEW